MYVQNIEIDLTRDVGTVVGWENERPEWPRVLFEDGEAWVVHRDDVKPLIEPHSKPKPKHLYFGCSENPCSWPGHS